MKTLSLIITTLAILLLPGCNSQQPPNSPNSDFQLQNEASITLTIEDYTGTPKHRFYRPEAVYVRFKGLPHDPQTVIALAVYGSPSHHIADHLHYRTTDADTDGVLGFYGDQAPLQEGLYVVRVFTRPTADAPLSDWVPLKESEMFEVWDVPAPSQQS